MSLIQIILLAAAFLAATLYFRYFRSVLRDRLIVVAFFLAAVAAILFPDLTSVAAKALGVGRGADLVLYLFVVTAVFCFIFLYIKVAMIERRQTELIREIALNNASSPDEEFTAEVVPEDDVLPQAILNQ